ncbi:hypothetical protein L8V77_06435 [Campylobacter sp. IFREMER_LSEM_CL2127]|uniref:hypothetical protein n=1 Tax=Campylobacter sp. IFREMER_LSEM_CL2127 TaxID=2911619 RepID=UPI0021E78A56|nr:hypothetical protein [Campylobacter sp. IFREMER_LSEM_CL2127]MCV3382012.1 hypothetical protein [Campylobacter sp. IFREMER_LSEM_CL2127]
MIVTLVAPLIISTPCLLEFVTLPSLVIVKVPPSAPLIVTPLLVGLSIVQSVLPLQVPPPLILLEFFTCLLLLFVVLLALVIVILPLEALSLIVVILALAQVAKKDIVAKDKKVFLVKERLFD